MGPCRRAGDDLRRLPDGHPVPLTPTHAVDRVWYASYGSNLCAEGFRCYLEGGTRRGELSRRRGARDTTPPLEVCPLEIPHRLYFARHSRRWDGSPCFVDSVESRVIPAKARAYLITWGQFEDVVAQENNSDPTPPIALAPDSFVVGSSHRVGTGFYGALLCVGRLDGLPVLTITSPRTMAESEAEFGPPSRAYIEMLADGLRQSHAMGDDAIVDYLGSAPGCSEELVAAALAPADESRG